MLTVLIGAHLSGGDGGGGEVNEGGVGCGGGDIPPDMAVVGWPGGDLAAAAARLHAGLGCAPAVRRQTTDREYRLA